MASKIEKLELLIGEWEQKQEALKTESSFARKHNFPIEAQILWDKATMIEQMCMNVRLRIIEELIN